MLASMMKEEMAFSPLVASVMAWCLNLSFLLRYMPSHLTVAVGIMVQITLLLSRRVMDGDESLPLHIG